MKPKVPEEKCSARNRYPLGHPSFFDIVSIPSNLWTIKQSSFGSNYAGRNKISITDVNNVYLQNDDLHVILLEEQYSWFDAGTADSLYEASGAVKEAQRSGKIIACLEETALHNRWITVEDLAKRAEEMKDNKYGEYLMSIVDENKEN